MSNSEFDKKLEIYADLALEVGVNLQPGQRLLIKSSVLTAGVFLEAAPFIRVLTKKAYQAGAMLVDVMWGDEGVQLRRFQHAAKDSFDQFPTWKTDELLASAKRGDAWISIRGHNPELLSKEDPDSVGTMQKTAMGHYSPSSEYISTNAINWLVIAVPSPDWAHTVYPDLPIDQAQAKLWEAVFEICRMNNEDPVAAWGDHIKVLGVRCAYMNEKQYTELKYKGPGIDLSVGMPKDHIWHGGQSNTLGGIPFTANLPTEEVFSLPHKDQVDGVVTASMPLNHGGALIKDFALTFEKGRVVKVTAKTGEEILKHMISSDEGAARLGEVALVAHSSSISQSGVVFNDPLIDENAASHLALGKGYKFCLAGGEKFSNEEFAARGGNNSIEHTDFMIGSGELDVDGVRADDEAEPVMRQGEWAFEL